MTPKICESVTFGQSSYMHVKHIQSGPKKVNPKCSTHNFVKYWPILKILSLIQSPENLQCSGH